MLRKDIHRQHLYRIIIDLFRSPVGRHLAFKGGTACYFLYGLPRFSTDIDLDLIGDRKQGDNIDDEIVQILSRYGTVKRGHHMILSYSSDDTNIHIDISRRIWQHTIYEIHNFFGQDIRVQDISTITANKLVALTERQKHRDYFDAWYLLSQGYAPHPGLVLERTGGSVEALYEHIIQLIDALPARYSPLDQLGETLYDAKQKHRVKTQLLADLKGLCQVRMMK